MNVITTCRRFLFRSAQLVVSRSSPATGSVLCKSEGCRIAISQKVNFTTSISRRLCDKVFREVHEQTEGDTTVVEATYRKPDDNYEDTANSHGACPICSRNLRITYKDVLILSQFIDDEGNLLPRDLTGVCAKQQIHLQECVERALAADLLPDHKPSHLRGNQEKEKGQAAFHRF